MAIPTFVQNSRINQVIYQIRDGQLWISERELWGKFQDRKIDLRWVDPDYRPCITRDYWLLVVPLVLAALCGAALWGGFRQTLIPVEATFYVLQWPAIGLAVFLAAAIRGSRRIEYYQFNNRAGKPVLSIIREPAQAEECAGFITTLVAHIELAQADLPAEQRAKLLSHVGADIPFTPAAMPHVAQWKISITLGVLAAGLPLVPNLENHIPLFEITYGLCFVGAVSCVNSFMTKEPGRWWSTIGLVLSLIPPYFYQ